MKGGVLAVTDANLVLGRLLPEYFPHIFGPNEDQSLDKAASCKVFNELTHEVNTSFLKNIVYLKITYFLETERLKINKFIVNRLTNSMKKLEK